MTDGILSVDGLEFVGGDGDCDWSLDTLDGWFDGPDTKFTDSSRLLQHGSFDVPVFSAARTVTVGGLCFTSTAAEQEDAARRLTRILPTLGPVVGHFGSRVLTGMGKRVGSAKFDPLVYGSVAEYQVQFWFPDPRLYGEQVALPSGSTVKLWHYGNTNAVPVFTVSGSMGSGYTITGPGGQVFQVSKPLVSGHPHTVDFRTGRVTVDGGLVVDQTPVAQVWTVPPGDPVTATLSGAGSGSLTPILRSTFL